MILCKQAFLSQETDRCIPDSRESHAAFGHFVLVQTAVEDSRVVRDYQTLQRAQILRGTPIMPLRRKIQF
jgi:hypothetical protein